MVAWVSSSIRTQTWSGLKRVSPMVLTPLLELVDSAKG
jgi:hypothetical protein